MVRVGEAVDHGNARPLRELDDVGVREGADHDRIDHAREHARHVADRLAAPELDVARREEQGVPAELVGADFEADPGPGGRLGENESDRLACQRFVAVGAGLHLARKCKYCIELRCGDVFEGEEVAFWHRGPWVG